MSIQSHYVDLRTLMPFLGPNLLKKESFGLYMYVPKVFSSLHGYHNSKGTKQVG